MWSYRGTFVLMLVLGVCAQAKAQDMKCDQAFMNPSEERICGSEALMQQDQIMGELYRRAEPHIHGIKKVQREFKRALKSCKGDEACLMRSYEARIEELKSNINSLPPPTEDQIQELSQAAEVQEEKREEQAEERAQIAAELPVEELPIVEDSVPVEAPVFGVPETVLEVAPEPTSASPIEWPWWAYVVLAFVALGIWLWFWGWLQVELKRCPQCRRWSAGEVYDRDQSAHTDYETRTFTDKHRDKYNNVTSTTQKERQVAVRVVNSIYYLKCKFCQKTWVRHTTSRSS